MTRARSPTASRTVRTSSRFSSSVVVGDSPVVPETTKPSHPWSTRCFARRAAAAVSREPSAANGVTIAVSRVPRRAGASNPTVLTVPKVTWRYQSFLAPAGSRFGGERAGRDLGAVGQGGNLEVGEYRGCDVNQLP